MTQYVHMAVYDTLADWEVGYATAHINSGDWQRDPGRYRGPHRRRRTEPVRTRAACGSLPTSCSTSSAPTTAPC